MLMIIGERLPPKLHGYLSQILLEIAPQTFVGVVSTRVRMQLCADMRRQLGPLGAATVVYTCNTTQGYTITVYGQTSYVPVECDGLQLMSARRITPLDEK